MSLIYCQAFYGLATAVYIFVVEIDVDWAIRKISTEEKIPGSKYVSHVSKERTKQLQELVALLYGAIPIFVYVFIGQLFVYSDPIWIPYAMSCSGNNPFPGLRIPATNL